MKKRKKKESKLNKWGNEKIIPFFFGLIYSLGLYLGGIYAANVFLAIFPNTNEIFYEPLRYAFWGLIFLTNHHIMGKGEFKKNINLGSLVLFLVITLGLITRYFIK